VLKPAQTGVEPGEPGDIDEVCRLAGDLTAVELARYAEPLAPASAARRAGRRGVRPDRVAVAARALLGAHDLVLIEGAGGLLVRLDQSGGTLADVATELGAPVLVVATAGLGTLNTAALTAEALRTRALACRGVVIGAWPEQPDLASRCNLTDLPAVTGVPLLGVLPEHAAALPRARFREVARHGLGPELGGCWQASWQTALP
jgi:dethiobiotin synthetase